MRYTLFGGKTYTRKTENDFIEKKNKKNENNTDFNIHHVLVSENNIIIHSYCKTSGERVYRRRIE